jgi:hypothetical protein
MTKLVSLILAVIVLGGCGSSAVERREGRMVMTQYNGWTMRITPSAASASDREIWRARVDVWPPDRDPGTYGGIRIGFSDVAPDEKSIVESAIRSARSYIDASRTRHQ